MSGRGRTGESFLFDEDHLVEDFEEPSEGATPGDVSRSIFVPEGRDRRIPRRAG
jgi:hypothetical protein